MSIGTLKKAVAFLTTDKRHLLFAEQCERNGMTALYAVEDDEVIVPRAEYERLLWLTTPQTIETAPRDKALLINGEHGWVEGNFDGRHWMTATDGSAYLMICNPTHWQHLPIMAQSEGTK